MWSIYNKNQFTNLLRYNSQLPQFFHLLCIWPINDVILILNISCVFPGRLLDMYGAHGFVLRQVLQICTQAGKFYT